MITTESTFEQTVITQENGRIPGQSTGQTQQNIRCKLLQNILYWLNNYDKIMAILNALNGSSGVLRASPTKITFSSPHHNIDVKIMHS